MAKRKKNDLPLDEDSIQREERDDEIVRGRPQNNHPHESQAPVGQDERDYMNDELREQGYGDEGLIQRKADKDEKSNPGSQRARKVA